MNSEEENVRKFQLQRAAKFAEIAEKRAAEVPDAEADKLKGKAVSAQYPDAVLDYFDAGYDEEGVAFEEGYTCVLEESECFIRCIGTFPHGDPSSDLEFGLWVELSEADFTRYLAGEDDEKAYASFQAEGTLANDWPLYPGSAGSKVEIRVIDAGAKPFITRIACEDAELNLGLKPMDEAKKRHFRKRLIVAGYSG
ncbi:MAG: DUF2199 domain-containing protein [Alphaproteobacteria bacterium]|nr:DUF2199 domain-containing protein [Alphaproteobacteria bacterium]